MAWIVIVHCEICTHNQPSQNMHMVCAGFHMWGPDVALMGGCGEMSPACPVRPCKALDADGYGACVTHDGLSLFARSLKQQIYAIDG